MSLTPQFVASVKERDGYPHKDNDERVDQRAREGCEESRQCQQQRARRYHDARLDRLQYTAACEGRADRVTDANRPGRGAAAASPSAG